MLWTSCGPRPSGLLLLITGAAVGFRTPGQVESLTRLYSSDAGAFAVQELGRMRKVNAMWPIYLGTWTAFAVIGLVLRFAVQRQWALGLGTVGR